MVSKQWLKDYALRIYNKTPGYSFEKVLKLFPKYYSSIKFYYQLLEIEKQKENATKAIFITQFINDSIALLQKFKTMGENMIKFHANRKEAKTLLDMKKITLDDINFDKKLLDEYESMIPYFKFYGLNKKELDAAINQQYLFLKQEIDLYNALEANDLEKVRSLLTNGRE